jgi:hypothetical protein
MNFELIWTMEHKLERLRFDELVVAVVADLMHKLDIVVIVVVVAANSFAFVAAVEASLTWSAFVVLEER